MSTANTQHQETYECETCGGPRTRESSVAGSFCSTDCHARHRGRGILRELRRDHKYCFTCFARLKELDEPTEQWESDKASRVITACDQGATFVPGPDGQIVLDATDCEYSEVVDVNQIIGFQYGTEHVTTGVIDIPLDDDIDVECTHCERTFRYSGTNWSATCPNCSQVTPTPYDPDYDASEREPQRVYEHMTLSRTGLVCQCGNTHHSNRETVIQDTSIVDVARNLIASIEQLRDEGVHDHHINPGILVESLRDQVGDEGWDFALAVGHAIQE